MIDQNRDGLIDVKDLQAIYAQIGMHPIYIRCVIRIFATREAAW